MSYPITFGKGLNVDAPPFELADGFWSAASNVRVLDGLAERIPGTARMDPFWISGAEVTAGTQWLGVSQEGSMYACSLTKIESINTSSSGGSDSSPITEGVAFTNMTRAGTTITVTAPAHGRTTGDIINVWGTIPSAYNAEAVPITVTGANTFTYVVAVAPANSPATTFGIWNYGSSRPAMPAIGSRPTGGNLGGIFILNRDEASGGVLYYNQPGEGFRRMGTGAVSSIVARIFKNYIIQLGEYNASTGVTNYYRVRWSSATEPGSTPSAFNAAVGNDAGLVNLTFGGYCVDCLPMGDVNIIYKKSGRIAMRYIGGNDVFSFTELPGTDGLWATDCAVDTPIGHVFISNNKDVLLHSGGVCTNLSEGRVGSYMRIGTPDFFVVKNARRREVWIYVNYGHPTYTGCNRALIWNWEKDTWGIREYTATTNIRHGVNFSSSIVATETLYIVDANGNLVREDIDSSAKLFEANYTSYVERTGMDAGDGDVVKNLQRSKWKFDAYAGTTFSIQHGSAMTPDATPTYASAATHTQGTTDYVNVRATGGKYLAVKCSWTPTTVAADERPGAIRTTNLDVTAGGRR